MKGKTVFNRVEDRLADGWGHLTFDDFSIDGTLAANEQSPADPRLK
ncbi:MAG: hypothetical protein N2C14_06185 [Planctomycetales bacterium]